MNTDELIALLEKIAKSKDTECILDELNNRINITERTNFNDFHRLQKIRKVIRLIQRIDDGQSFKDWR